jgi:hypothetical protein
MRRLASRLCRRCPRAFLAATGCLEDQTRRARNLLVQNGFGPVIEGEVRLFAALTVGVA